MSALAIAARRPTVVFGLSPTGPFTLLDPTTSYWVLPPTPRAGEGHVLHRPTEFSERWPRHGVTRGGRAYLLEDSGHSSCRSVAARSWPTPNAKVSNFGERPRTWYARRSRLKKKGYNGNGAGVPLAIAAQVGPGWREATAASQAEAPGGRLNPTWVEWLMGFPLGWTRLPGEARVAG